MAGRRKKVKFGERVGHGGWLIGPKLFLPEAYPTCVSSKLYEFIDVPATIFFLSLCGANLLPGRVAPLKRQTVVDLLIRSKLYKVGTFLLMRLHLLLLSLFPALMVDKYLKK